MATTDEPGADVAPAALPPTQRPRARIPPIDLALETGVDAETAWRALTDPDTVALWLAPSSPVGRPGSPYRLEFGDTSVVVGEVLEVEPGRRFAHTWAWEGDDSADVTVVTWTLEPLEPGRTRLRLVHEGWRELESEAARDDHEAYWSGYLDDLRDILEEG